MESFWLLQISVQTTWIKYTWWTHSCSFEMETLTPIEKFKRIHVCFHSLFINMINMLGSFRDFGLIFQANLRNKCLAEMWKPWYWLYFCYIFPKRIHHQLFLVITETVAMVTMMPRWFQGPLPSTSGHFWLMVWEQNTKAVLMLNRVVERGRVGICNNLATRWRW